MQIGSNVIMKKINIKELAKEMVWVCGVLLEVMIFENFEF